MMGKTHFNVGILYFAILSFVPVFSCIGITQMPGPMIVICFLTAGYAALIPDLDCSNSLFYNNNPVGIVVTRAVSLTRRIINRLVYTTIMIITCLLIYSYKTIIVNFITNILKIRLLYNGSIAIWVILSVYVLLTLAGPKAAPAVPITGWLYMLYEYLSYVAATAVKKVLLASIYICSAIVLAYYNYSHQGAIWGYLAALLIILAVTFPHRTLLHSPEGLIMFSLVFYHYAAEMGKKQAGIAFTAGYFSHLYLSDIFTYSGVPLSFLGYILKKMPWNDSAIKRSKIYAKFIGILNIRLSLPIIKTGTKHGNLAEGIYVALLLLAAGVLAYINYVR